VRPGALLVTNAAEQWDASYSINTGIPLVTQGNTQFINENASGVLAIEPGKSYEIFKSSTRTYTVTVTSENAGKEKQK
jgi:hypothetical protein